RRHRRSARRFSLRRVGPQRTTRHGLRHPRRRQRLRRLPLQPYGRISLERLQRPDRLRRLRVPFHHRCYIDSAASLSVWLKSSPRPTSPLPLPPTFSPSSEPFSPGFAPASLSWASASSSPALEFLAGVQPQTAQSTVPVVRPLPLVRYRADFSW